MKWSLTTALAVTVLGPLSSLFAPAAAHAQEWSSPRTLALVRHATGRREAQLADTGLRNYKAEARGYLTFLAQLGEGYREPPKIVRTDQIASDVYWQAPNLSKQLIKGRRDTLLLPTDINYHRDHLGIVQNNFPNIIRLGDGDEVEDVPHPLSPAGLAAYEYGLRDSLTIRLGPRSLAVYEVAVRPRNDRLARAVGSVYIDRESGEVVRMTLSFTRAALKDPDLEDVSIVIENALVEGRFWLPHRQELEIRRTGTWLDYPVRGIIRGRWEIDDYEVNTPAVGVVFDGPEIVAAPGSAVRRDGTVTNRDFKFQGGILDSLPPDVAAASDADVRRVQDQAREMVRRQALARSRTLALSGRRVSDFLHVNRVEGIAAGAGLVQSLGGGFAIGGHAAYGFSDHDGKGEASLAYRRPSGAGVQVVGYRTLRDVSEVPERSGVINTFAAQEFGSDYTDLYRVRGGAVRASTGTLSAIRASAELAFERQDSASVHARPADGRYEPTIPALSWRETRVTVGLDMPTALGVGGIERSAALRVDWIHGNPVDPNLTNRMQVHGVLDFNAQRSLSHGVLVWRTIAAGVWNPSAAVPQHLIYLGGPVSAPGYDFHSLVGDVGMSQRIEWQAKVPFIGIPLGGWGRAPATVTLAPYVNEAWVNQIGSKPSVGLGVLTLFDLLRFDVARGLNDGRWSFGFDVSRTFWGVL